MTMDEKKLRQSRPLVAIAVGMTPAQLKRAITTGERLWSWTMPSRGISGKQVRGTDALPDASQLVLHSSSVYV